MLKFRSHHIALKSVDYARAKAFYTQTLGLPIIGQIPGKEVIFLDIGGTTIELMGGAPAALNEPPAAGLTHMAFEVDNVDATFIELKAKGVPFTVEPKDAGDIRVAFFKDPDGNLLELFRSPTLTWKK